MTTFITSTSEVHEGGKSAGSLTTIFQFPESCGGPMTGDPWSQDLDCALPHWDIYSKQTWGWHLGFYSPAICPEGYTLACTRPLAGALGPPVELGEEAYHCLPSGYSCAEYPTTLVGTSAGPGVAPLVQIRWAESDIPILETHPLAALETETVPTTVPTTPPGLAGATEASLTSLPSETSPVSTSSTSEPEESTGLPMAAKAGIAVGVSVGVLIAILIGVLVWRSCRKRQENDKESNVNSNSPKGPYSSASSSAMHNQPMAPHEINNMYPRNAQPTTCPVIRFETPSYPSPRLGPLDQNPVHGFVPPPRPIMELPTDGHELPTLNSTPSQLEAQEQQVLSPPSGPAVGSTAVNDQNMNAGMQNATGSKSHTTPEIEPAVLSTPAQLELPVILVSDIGGDTNGSPGSPALASSIHSGATGIAANSELASLYRRESELDAKRERLMQLKQVDEDQEMVRHRIQQLEQSQIQQ